jgi:hypothetical protein
MDLPGLIGPILVHHEDIAERLRSGLRAKQQGELCRRAGEQTLFTSGCHESKGMGGVGGIFVMVVVTGMVDR